MISICVATIRPDTLLDTVNAICHQTWEDWELIIVGQGQDPAFSDISVQIRQKDARNRYIHLDQKGLSIARNAGMRAARGDWIAFTDDDCEPTPDWLMTIAEYAQSGQRIDLVGGSLVAPPPRMRGKVSVCPAIYPEETLYDSGATPQNPPQGWDWVGGNFAISRELVQQIGFFDEHIGAGTIFPAGEDTDYKLRIEAKGLRMAATPRSVVHHTYGHRYGFQSILRHSRNYARGNGALAAKFTLLGDSRGRVWCMQTMQEVLALLRQPKRIYRLPLALNRLRHFMNAYHECLQYFTIDTQTNMLQLKS